MRLKALIVMFLIFISSPVLADDELAFSLSKADIAEWGVTENRQLNILMAPHKAAEFAEYTETNLNKRVSLYIENVLLVSAVVREPILSGRMHIFGAENTEEVINILESSSEQ